MTGDGELTVGRFIDRFTFHSRSGLSTKAARRLDEIAPPEADSVQFGGPFGASVTLEYAQLPMRLLVHRLRSRCRICHGI